MHTVLIALLCFVVGILSFGFVQDKPVPAVDHHKHLFDALTGPAHADTIDEATETQRHRDPTRRPPRSGGSARDERASYRPAPPAEVRRVDVGACAPQSVTLCLCR
jgi:hypothetical protein